MRWLFRYVALALPVALFAKSLCRHPLINVTFDGWQTTTGDGKYTREMAAKDFGAVRKIEGQERAWVRNADRVVGGQGEPALKVLFPKDQTGPLATGIFIVVPLNASRGYFLQYRVKFDGENFDFVKGGMLPGLGSGLDHGLVANFVWEENGRIGLKYSQFGDRAVSILETDRNVQPNKWFFLKMSLEFVEDESYRQDDKNKSKEIKYIAVMNAWIDHELVVFKDDLPITGPKHEIDEFYFFTFYNNDGTNASKSDKDQYIYFTQVNLYSLD